MASYRAIHGALTALKDYLDVRLGEGLAGVIDHPSLRILGSEDLLDKPSGNVLGIYLHRVSVDSFGRNRYLQPQGIGRIPRPELPVNLHILLIGWSDKAVAEVTLVAWAMQLIGSALELDISHLGLVDPRWGNDDTVQVIPEEMSTEDLMRVWDSLPGDYHLSSPYIIKTLRLEPEQAPTEAPLARSIVTPFEEVGEV